MAKFIELHNNDGAVLLNIDHITAVYLDEGMSVVFITNGENETRLRFKDPYDQIRRMIAIAQGGIPMRRDKTVEGAPG